MRLHLQVVWLQYQIIPGQLLRGVLNRAVKGLVQALCFD